MVNPGYAGQKMVPSTIKKVRKLNVFLKERDRENIILEVDGNISEENGSKLRRDGANIFVAGSSSIFKNDMQTYSSNIIRLRRAIGK